MEDGNPDTAGYNGRILKVATWLKFVIIMAMCTVVGTPQATFSSIQHYMLSRHVFEDRCVVTYTEESGKFPVYCMQSRAAYVNMYNAAGIGFALSVLPAYIVQAVKFVYFWEINVMVACFLTVGFLLSRTKPEDPWIHDRYVYGYALVSMCAPFAIFNALKAISFCPLSRFGRMTLVVCLFSLLQLGPFIWSVIDNKFRFANGFISICIFCVVFCVYFPEPTPEIRVDTLLSQLSAQFSLGKEKLLHVDSPALLTPVGSADDPLMSDLSDIYPKQGYIRTVFSLPFLALLLSYFANSLPLDLMIVGGEARAAFHEELSVSSELNGFSPLIAAASFPLLLLVASRFGLRVLAVTTTVACILQSLGQFWSVRMSWIACTLLVGTCQAALMLTTALCFMKCISTRFLGSTAATFYLTVAIIKFYVLPFLDISIEFDQSILGHSPYAFIVTAQVFSSLLFWAALRKELYRECRDELEMEARLVFANDD